MRQLQVSSDCQAAYAARSATRRNRISVPDADDTAALMAKVERLEATNTILAAEARAMQNRYERRAKRVDGLEDRDHSEAL